MSSAGSTLSGVSAGVHGDAPPPSLGKRVTQTGPALGNLVVDGDTTSVDIDLASGERGVLAHRRLSRGKGQLAAGFASSSRMIVKPCEARANPV
jgi:hypothetical protein